MAVTFTQLPGTLNFSNNPILLTAKTSLSRKTFLRIICEATFQLAGDNTEVYKEAYSSPVSDGGTVTFNLSNASKVYYNQKINEITSTDASMYAMQTLSIQCYEKWIDSYGEQTGTKVNVSGEILILPGGLTDFERMKLTNIDLEALIGDAKELSRKPQYGGVVYPGERILMPYFSMTANAKETSSAAYSNGDYSTELYVRQPKAVGLVGFEIDDSHVGKTVTTSISVGRNLISKIVPLSDKVKFLRFINGFGAVENISVCVNDTLEYAINTEESTLIGEPSFRNINRRMSRKTTDTGSYALSSGYVNNVWAEWFTHEVLMTPRAWMLIDGVWVPGDIIPEDTVQMYDRTEPGLQNVGFTFKMGIEGGTVNRFML